MMMYDTHMTDCSMEYVGSINTLKPRSNARNIRNSERSFF
jgi:hypothetical protein